MKKLVIYSTVYPDIVKLIDAINKVNLEWEIIGFIDDRKELQGKNVLGIPVIGGSDLIKDLVKEENIYFINNYALYPESKKRISLLESYNCKIPSLIHPGVDTNYVKIGRGCIIPDGCILGGNTEIGDYVIMRLSCTISHDVKIDNYTFIGPGSMVGGNVTLKKGCFLGASATIMREKTVGAASIIGAGAMVNSNIPDGITVAGVPAKKLRKSFIKRVFKRLKREWKNNFIAQAIDLFPILIMLPNTGIFT